MPYIIERSNPRAGLRGNSIGDIADRKSGALARLTRDWQRNDAPLSYGVGGLAGELEKESLKDRNAVAAGKMSLAQAQKNYDARAASLRASLTQAAQAQNSAASFTGVKKSPAQMTNEIEAQIVKQLGKRPGVVVVPTLNAVVKRDSLTPNKSTDANITFSSTGTDVGGGNTMLIAAGAGALILGFLVLRR